MIPIDRNKKEIRILVENKPNFLVVFLLIIFVLTLTNTTTPTNFPDGKTITIEKGQTIKNTAEILSNENIIRSEIIFNLIVTISDAKVVEGTYLFHTPENVFKVIDRVTHGNYQIPVEKITFFEGDTSYDMAKKLKSKIPNFDVDTFYELAQINEGYLFPDTYEFRQTISAEEVIKNLRDNFDSRIEEVKDLIDSSDKSLDEIIKMASIIEGEADNSSMQEVANILWKRFEMDMLLQVDATFVYSINKSTFDLTLEDLNDKDNPYNSYEHRGLPPTPISNPGLRAIKAAAGPQPTPNLYFLTGRDGNMYYASSFEGHKQNRFLYLD